MNHRKGISTGHIAIILLLIPFVFTSCAGAGTQQPNQPSQQNQPNQQDNPAPKAPNQEIATSTPVPSPAIEQYGFISGMYKIGKDMPAGEYKLFATEGLSGVSYFEIAKDSTNSLESIIANDNFFSFTYVTVSEGQYFKFTDARAVPVDQAEKSGPVEGRYASGMYKVGVDIPAGEYKVLPEENSTLGFGYFEVTKTSRHILDDIVSNDNFEDSRYITLENGQYLKLSEAYIDAGAQ